jgi:choline dehydrogenase-like flavoprotein
MADPEVLIVGAGTAGCVLAARLSEDPACTVLLLEAGPDLRSRMPPEVRSGWRPTRSFDWGYASEPDEHGVVRELPRGRLVGGCSSTNATFALRGSPADYDAWAKAGNQGWSFEELLPYFVRLERDEDFGDRPWHGEAGPLPIRRYRADELTDVAAASLEAFDSLGIPRVEDHNAPGAVGAGPAPVNCRNGVRMSTALTYLPPPRERDNLTVRCEAEVARLVLDGTRAVGVRLTSGQELRSRCVALCAGAYGSPTLLLRSGVGPADELAKLGVPVKLDLPGVGCNLIDHPSVSVTIPYRSTPDPAPLFQVVATLRSDGSSPHDPPDLQLLTAGPYPAEGDERPSFMSAAALLKPRSRGQLSLRSGDHTEPPSIRLGYLTEQTDVDRLAQGLERAEELAAHPAFRALGTADVTTTGDSPPRADERRDWLQRNCWTYHHAVGTCAMGAASDPAAVVDGRGRLHGSEGLYVVDASVMPDVPSANTHIPTVMVAERLAEMLAAELR